MSTVAFHLYEAVQAGLINEEHIQEELFQECLFAIETRSVDLLIRTSGYKRISDFLSWQVHKMINKNKEIPSLKKTHLRKIRYTYPVDDFKKLRITEKKLMKAQMEIIEGITMFQVANGIVYFSDVLWPEFSRIQFLKALFYYQMNARVAPIQSTLFEYEVADFLQESKNEKRLYLLKYSYDFGLLPTLDLSKIYTYDYEILYEFFLKKYKL